MKVTKEQSRRRIHWRIRKKVNGTPNRPRLCVFRSNKYIYCQLIDDVAGHTLASASSTEEQVPKNINKVEQAKMVGKLIAERAKAENIETLVFDRGGYLYHGRVKALADGAREEGLKF
ncbi:MAG TPA: 50S ribosomal protein L18 [Saprospiraceae bacterium]|nr:50S ribosomal protein L18 [Saprospiraceae bacterium]HMQ83192.1 50S ribosomal protein L18 [Saprospiraceae bacterium]